MASVVASGCWEPSCPRLIPLEQTLEGWLVGLYIGCVLSSYLCMPRSLSLIAGPICGLSSEACVTYFSTCSRTGCLFLISMRWCLLDTAHWTRLGLPLGLLARLAGGLRGSMGSGPRSQVTCPFMLSGVFFVPCAFGTEAGAAA